MELSRRNLVSAVAAGAAVTLLASCGKARESVAKITETVKNQGKASDDGEAVPSQVTGFDERVRYLVFGADSKGPVVELFVDYRCPHCKVFSEVNGEYLKKAVESGDIQLRVYPRPMLDARTGTTFSIDTANAVTATYIQDPSLYWELDTALFALQPESAEDETPGTEEVAKAAKSVGANEETVQAIVDGKYDKWIETVEAEGQDREIGTPTVYVNDVMVEADLSVEGELQKAVEAA